MLLASDRSHYFLKCCLWRRKGHHFNEVSFSFLFLCVLCLLCQNLGNLCLPKPIYIFNPCLLLQAHLSLLYLLWSIGWSFLYVCLVFITSVLMKTFLHWTILIPLSELTRVKADIYLWIHSSASENDVYSYNNHTDSVTMSFEIQQCNFANFVLLSKFFELFWGLFLSI